MNMKTHPGAAIRAARRAIEMKQSELAAAVGRSPSYICGFEFGAVKATAAEIEAMRRAIVRARRAKAAT